MPSTGISALSGSSIRAVSAGSSADDEALVHGSFRIVSGLACSYLDGWASPRGLLFMLRTWMTIARGLRPISSLVPTVLVCQVPGSCGIVSVVTFCGDAMWDQLGLAHPPDPENLLFDSFLPTCKCIRILPCMEPGLVGCQYLLRSSLGVSKCVLDQWFGSSDNETLAGLTTQERRSMHLRFSHPCRAETIMQ